MKSNNQFFHYCTLPSVVLSQRHFLYHEIAKIPITSFIVANDTYFFYLELDNHHTNDRKNLTRIIQQFYRVFHIFSLHLLSCKTRNEVKKYGGPCTEKSLCQWILSSLNCL